MVERSTNRSFYSIFSQVFLISIRLTLGFLLSGNSLSRVSIALGLGSREGIISNQKKKFRREKHSFDLYSWWLNVHKTCDHDL